MNFHKKNGSVNCAFVNLQSMPDEVLLQVGKSQNDYYFFKIYAKISTFILPKMHV